MICVVDANVWIDLSEGELLEEAFQLQSETGLSWMTPDLILAEEVLSVSASRLRELGVTERPLSGEELGRIPELSASYPRPSPKDLSLIVAAREEGGILVSGDGALRDAASSEGLPVHGILWVLDQLVEEEITPGPRAASALRAMLEAGSRLPASAVEKRLRRWEKS